MNKTRILIAIGVAVLLALFAGVGAYKFLSESGRRAEQARSQTAGVVVAIVDIPLASTINASQVAVMPWPKGNLPKDALGDPKMVVGRVARREFVGGEPIIESKLVPADKTAGIMSLKVPEGMRAFTVQVNEVVGVGGFIAPDARVDVVLTTAWGARQQISKIVLEDVWVLAAGQAVERRDNKPVTVNTVTLAVTPKDAEKLALAVHDGKINLVLRNFIDNAVVTTTGADKESLLTSFRPGARVAEEDTSKTKRSVRKKAPRPPPVVTRTVHNVEIIKGNRRSVATFD